MRVNTVDLAVGIGIVLFLVAIGAFIVTDARTQANCLRQGWANHTVTWNLVGYCIREENEYEITVPLSELE